ncbi:DNA pilot protein [Dipodfec virus RodF1_85]|uniref:DNA pilot protein n=1 Tax=Dipodfec virus RodF1_85 TaxID=2929314 RepID=A0A976N308_9VIRU|nr:DNA pilot protein [Dipodfec virus RodF1_85]
MGFDLGSIAGAAISGGASLVGGMMNATMSKTIAREQMRQQKEFAQNGIQWRVEDAKKAGLHPLYAIGAQGASYTPVSQDSSSLGNAVADAGQYLGRAIDGSLDNATRKAIEQENLEYARTIRELTQMKAGAEVMNLELQNRRLKLDNDAQEMLNSQRTLASSNPGRPVSVSTPMGEFNVNNPDIRRYTRKVAGNGATALAGVSLKPAEVVISSPGNPAQTAGANSDYSLIRTDNGYTKVPSQAFADSTDDDIVAKIAWHMRNTVGDRLNYLVSGRYPELDTKVYPLPKGLPAGMSSWRYHPLYGEYYPYDAGTRRYWRNSSKSYFY